MDQKWYLNLTDSEQLMIDIKVGRPISQIREAHLRKLEAQGQWKPGLKVPGWVVQTLCFQTTAHAIKTVRFYASEIGLSVEEALKIGELIAEADSREV